MIKGRIAYGWLWIWFLVVLGASIFVYVQILHLTGEILPPDWSKIAERIKPEAWNPLAEDKWHWKLAIALKLIGGVLFCWRVVKVVVLHGAPYSPWLRLSAGREDSGVSGRIVHYSHIGDHNVYSQSFTGGFWFAAVFRAHPRSDKLVRTRLEFLIATLPFGRALVVEESRIFFTAWSDEERAKEYMKHRAKYVKMVEAMNPDRFRRDMVKHTKAISDHLKEQSIKRIDGLNWEIFRDQSMHIEDDFGYGMDAVKEDGKFRVSGLGDEGRDTRIVNSISELRDLAKSDLNPVP